MAAGFGLFFAASAGTDDRATDARTTALANFTKDMSHFKTGVAETRVPLTELKALTPGEKGTGGFPQDLPGRHCVNNGGIPSGCSKKQRHDGLSISHFAFKAGQTAIGEGDADRL